MIRFFTTLLLFCATAVAQVPQLYSVANPQALAQLTPSGIKQVFVRSTGDTYQWDSTNTLATNLVTSIQWSTNSVGRWTKITNPRKTVFNLADDYGATTNADCVAALANALNDAWSMPGGATIRVPALFPISSLDITNSSGNPVTFEGPGGFTINATNTGYPFKITAPKMRFRWIDFDGAYKTLSLVRMGNYSTNWYFEGCHLHGNQINSNTGNTNSTGDMFLGGDGCRDVTFDYCRLDDFDSLLHSTSASAALRGIRFACFPATTNWTVDRFEDVRIRNTTFSQIGPGEPNADAVCFQNQPPNELGEQIVRADISGNFISGVGRRGIKLECGGEDAHDNWIFSTRTGGNPDWMFSGISGYGPAIHIHHNHFYGGSSFYGIELATLPTFGVARGCAVDHNEITLNSTGNDFSYGVTVKGAVNSAIDNNTVKNARVGFSLLGSCDGVAATGNIEDNASLYGFNVVSETDTNQGWYGVPRNCTIAATVINGAAGEGVRVDNGTNIVVIGTTGHATGQLLFSSTNTVNTILRGNVGATESVLASSSSASYYLRIDAAAADIGSVKFYGPFENPFLTYDSNNGGVSRLSLGRPAPGQLVLGGVILNRNSQKFETGSGSPEGVVTAIVGSIYLRTDGGASSSFYVKESGTGNTGWSAK